MQNHNLLGKKAGAAAALKGRVLSIFAWTFILACLVLVFHFSRIGLRTLFLTSNKHFALNKVSIVPEGIPSGINGLTDSLAIRQALKLKTGTNLFNIDLKSLQQQVEELTVVDSARIEYILPNELKVTYTEKQPVARLISKNCLIDRSGLILPDGRDDLNLPGIFPRAEVTPGQKVFEAEDDENLNSVKRPLELINLVDSMQLTYKGKTHAVLSLIKVKTVSISPREPNTLIASIRALPGHGIVENTRIKFEADRIKRGLRRACIQIIENRSKISHIDSRFSHAPTK